MRSVERFFRRLLRWAFNFDLNLDNSRGWRRHRFSCRRTEAEATSPFTGGEIPIRPLAGATAACGDSRVRHSGDGCCGFPDHQLRCHLAMHSANLSFLDNRADPFQGDRDGHRPHGLHRLAHGGQSRGAKGCRPHIVKSYHRAIVRKAQVGFDQRPDRAKGGHVIKSHDGGEPPPPLQHFFRQPIAAFSRASTDFGNWSSFWYRTPRRFRISG